MRSLNMPQSINLDWYDYGARFYDPALARFVCSDPIADQFPHVSPYNYAENRPISGIDLWGLQYLDFRSQMLVASRQHEALTGEPLYTPQEISQFAGAYERGILAGTGASVATFGVGYAVATYGAKAVLIYAASEAAEAVVEEITGIPIIIDPADIAEKAVKGAFKEAASKELGTFLRNNIDESVDVVKGRLKRSISSHSKQIGKHNKWLADPKSKYGDRWDKFSEKRKKNILHHWKEDKKRHKAYKEVKQGALDTLED